MRQTIWTGTCAALVSLATAGIFAQTAGQTAPPPTPQTAAPQAAAPSSDNKVTVTGCLKAAPQASDEAAGAAATAGTSGTSTSATAGTTGTAATGATGTAGSATEKFVLTGASATPADAGSAPTYRLIANPSALSQHIGKKLELTGTIDKTSTADPKDPSASAPALKVESGKVIAASCSE